LVLFTAGWTMLALLAVRLCVESASGMRRAYWILGGAVVLLLASLGGRTNIFMPAIVILVLVHYLGRRIDLKRMLFYGVCLFVAMSLYGYVRDVSYSGSESMEWVELLGLPPEAAPALYAYLYIKYPVATYRDLTEIIPSQVPYQWGSVTLSPFRTFLPGDQQMADSFYKATLQSDFPGGGQPAGFIASFYCDFGFAGIVLGMFFLGILAAFSYRAMKDAKSVLPIMIYAWLMQSFLFGLFTGPFPYITTLWIPFFWFVLDRIMSNQGLMRTKQV
jgi:oligosaccharide repeat unit polymerase